MTPKQIETQLHLWQGLKGGKATLINLSENHTFRIDMPDGAKHILRVHRPNYQNHAAIKSELFWLEALKKDTDISLITPVKGCDDEFVQQVAREDKQISHAVRFIFEKGAEADENEQEKLFADLGRFAATCHNHAQNWQLPKGFSRPTWNEDTILNKDGLWGNWRAAPNVVGETLEILEKGEIKLRQTLLDYGKNNSNFGLIHADMRSANLLINEGKTRLIDFDDCGFSWFAYDFAASVSFFEHSDIVPELKKIWLNSYRKIRPFSQIDEDILDAVILLRRMALLAWVQSHKETELAQAYAKDFAKDSAGLAQNFLLKSN